MGQRAKNKQKSIVASECPYFENCDIRLGRSEHLKRILALIHLTIRFIYTFVAWAVLAKGIESTAFFVSLFLFTVPVLMDCVQFGFAGWSREGIVTIEILICLLWLIFAALGIAGIFLVSLEEGVYVVITASDFIGFQMPSFPVQRIWVMLGSIPFITGVDFACRYSAKRKKEGEVNVK